MAILLTMIYLYNLGKTVCRWLEDYVESSGEEQDSIAEEIIRVIVMPVIGVDTSQTDILLSDEQLQPSTQPSQSHGETIVLSLPVPTDLSFMLKNGLQVR